MLHHVPIDPATLWTKLSAVEDGALGHWAWLRALARPDGALLHDPNLGRHTQAARIAEQLKRAPDDGSRGASASDTGSSRGQPVSSSVFCPAR